MKPKWKGALIGGIVGLLPSIYLILRYKDVPDMGFASLSFLIFSIFFFFICILMGIMVTYKRFSIFLLTILGFALPWIVVLLFVERSQRHNYFFYTLLLSLTLGILIIILSNLMRKKRKIKSPITVCLIFSLLIIFHLGVVSAYIEESNPPKDPNTLSVMYHTDAKIEFIIDAPHKIKSTEAIPLFVAIHDIDETADGYSFYYIKIYDNKPGNRKLVKTLYPSDLGLTVEGTCSGEDYVHFSNSVDNHYWYKLINLNQDIFDDSDGNIYIDALVDGVFSCLIFDDDETAKDSLKIEIDERKIPKISEWYCGDTHYHSSYTDTQFVTAWDGEFGGPIDITINMLNFLGLDWITITDHSNSFSGHKNDEFKLKWEDFKEDCNNYDQCLIGTEINCGYTSINSGGNHLLAYDYNSFIDDKFSDFLPSSNNPSCEKMIGDVQSQGGFTYVAHPTSTMDALLGFVNVINPLEDYSLEFDGLEIWNGDINNEDDIEWDGKSVTKGTVITKDLENGLKNWTRLVLDGRKVFISAGTDAHGDFQGFGKEYTCCYAPSYSKSNIFNSLENGTCYMGNNGALVMEVGYPSHMPVNIMAKYGETIEVCDKLSFHLDFNYNILDECRLSIYEGDLISKTEKVIENGRVLAGENEDGIIWNNFASDNVYYRAECISNDEKNRIYTNPIWVNVHHENFDEDEICDYHDEDDDNDLVLDVNEAEGCQFDLDCDDDTYNDTIDLFPKDPTEWSDNDVDGTGDNADLDDDNDEVNDTEDLCNLEYGQYYEQGCPDLIPPEVTLNLSSNLVLGNEEIIIICEHNDTDPNPIHKLFVTKPSNKTLELNCSTTVFNETDEEGEYQVYFEAIDGGNNSASINDTFNVDLCTPNWTSTEECKEDDSFLVNYTDENGCYALTNLDSDLENKPNDTTSQFYCDYDGDGFIGDILDINTTLENVTKEQINNTIKFKENDKTLLEFEFNLTEEQINLANLFIEKQNNESNYSYMIIKGLDLTSQNQTKTIYLDKILGGTGLCIRDEELTLISEISDDCTGENETWIVCPGSSGDYTCELVNNETQYKISGLRHSGIKEQETFCGDGVKNGDEECEGSDIPKGCGDYGHNAGSLSCTASCTIDSSGCYTQDIGDGGGSGGGGGGGGGGGSSSASTTAKKTNQTTPTSTEQNKTTEIIPEPNLNETESNETITQDQGGLAGITGAFIGGIVDKGKSIIAIIFIVLISGGVVGMWIWKRKNKAQVVYAPKEIKIEKEEEIKEPYWKELMRKLTDKEK